LHAGYNLKPGSTKAAYCVEGNRRLRVYCQEHGIALHEGGILIVARLESEIPVIEELKSRAEKNGVEARIVGEEGIRQLEPHAHGIQALHAPQGASFDAAGFVARLMLDAEEAGAEVMYDTRVVSISDPSLNSHGTRHLRIETNRGIITASSLVNCGGLHADRLAGALAEDVRVIPFRGYYAELKPDRTHLVRSHVYSAPDLTFPFLGVHASRWPDGRVLLGPGAMLAFGREAYRLQDFDAYDLATTLAWPGFRRLIVTPEMRRLVKSEVSKSLSLKAIWKEAQLLFPELEPTDLVRSFAGNRAQMVLKNGELVGDILVRETERAVHVLNAVSPGLTCSLPFGEYLAGRCVGKLG
jgi:L-2-hydroxyglutarate oxidase